MRSEIPTFSTEVSTRDLQENFYILGSSWTEVLPAYIVGEVFLTHVTVNVEDSLGPHAGLTLSPTPPLRPRDRVHNAQPSGDPSCSQEVGRVEASEGAFRSPVK